ncbi:MAG: tRNA guanosine(34) transglycosylase Tgt [Phycisphaerae bacterium]|nr:tRNA guanosine(34) transglycosylase Tgt [Phycisphaerae bacterium]
MFSFHVTRTCGKARLGRLSTPHGEVDTPVFMPVGTAGSVKGVTPDQLRAAGVRMVLANTYHLMLRPGAATVEKLGGLHRFMAWDGPLLTDSGGYQVFSLAPLRRIDDDGVVFRSHIDGSPVRLSPEDAVTLQRQLGADILMQLDECPPGDADKPAVAQAVRRSADWARRCKEVWAPQPTAATTGKYQALFGIQQGGTHADLRAASTEALVALDLPGYAIGGLSVGEGSEAMRRVLGWIDGLLPADRPRYLMGVGSPADILAAVQAGVDMFDCVLPTRNGRNAEAFTWTGQVRLRNARWTGDDSPLEVGCPCATCRQFSRGALRHYFLAKEMLAPTLVSLHNLHFFSAFLAAIRQAITDGDLASRAEAWLARMSAEADSPGNV